MKHIGKAILLLLICTAALSAQVNLVPNESFEQHNKCPNDISTVAREDMPQEYVMDWIAPTFGTTDYFHACAFVASVPNNFAGYQPAADGEAYCGLFVFATDDTTTNDYIYREYLLAKLKTPLQQGKAYCVSFYASPAEVMQFNYASFMYAAKGLGAYISHTSTAAYDSITQYRHAQVLSYTPQIEATEVMSDTSRWYRISGVYTAEGGEQWITIGNFKDDMQTEGSVLISTGLPEAYLKFKSYYFIDKVSVFSMEEVKILPEDFSACVSDFPVSITAKSGLESYHWNTGDTLMEINAAVEGTYMLEAPIEGCIIRDTIKIQAMIPPTLDLGPDIDNCVDGIERPVQLKNETSLENYVWSTGEQTEQITVSQTGVYSLTTEHLCGTFTDEIHLSGCEPLLYVPNVFAPGAAGVNGYFLPYCKNVQLEILQVYNNWGMLLYQEDNPTQGWDGTFNNQICPPGVYVWFLTYRANDNLAEMRKYGDVTLIR